MGSLSEPYLTGFASADGPFYVNDVLEIQVCSSSSHLCDTVYSHDFSHDCTAGAAPKRIGPVSIGKYLHSGFNEVTFHLRNRCGQREGSSNIYLTGYGVIDPNLVGSSKCGGNLTRWIGGLVGKPIYESQPDNPSVGPDHKVHGVGTVEVAEKINCSAGVEITLQTRVCNRFGGNCNPRDIAKSGIDPLPDGGHCMKDLTGACRSGKDDYRVQIHVFYTTYDGLQRKAGFPVLTVHQDYTPDGDKGWTSLTC